MPGTILLSDFRDSIGDELRRHVDGLTQLGSSAIQTIGNAPQQVTEALPQAPQVDPNQVLQELQQHVATITQPVQQAEQQVAGAADQTRQNVQQTLQDYAGGLTSVQTPQPPQQAPAPAQSDVNPPVATGTQQNATDAVPQDTTSGRVFPVQGYNGQVDLHWGDVKGGSDLFAPRGTPVVAMEPGKVVESGQNSVGGNSVLVQGDDGLQYYYAHGDATPSVNVGDRVTAGQYLMPVGDTGDAKGRGTHLHIGIGPDIRLGADKYGGTGGDYDAVGLLRGTLAPQDQQQGPAQHAQQAVAGAVQAGQAIVGQGQKAFVDTLQPLAQQVAQRTGIDPNAMLAIAANETGWGQSQNAQQQNNLFSIQGDGSNGSRWASYKSPQESFSAFVNLISSAPRYAQAWADRADPVRFIDDLRNAGYVADEPGFPAQGWVDQVKSIYQHLPVGQPTTADDAGVSAQRQAAVIQVGDQTRPAAKQPLYAGVMQDAQGNPVADGQQNPIQVIGDVVQRGRQAVSQVASDISDAAQGAAARQQAQLPGGPFNRLEPGAEGGPPQYTNFGQAAAMSGPTSPGAAISGAVSGAVSGAQQALAPVVSGAQEAVAGAYRQGRTEAEQAEFNQRQQQDTLAAAEAMRRQSEEQAARPLDVGQQASNAWNLIVGANPPMGISYQDYQNAQDAKNQWIEQNNPLRDVKVAGGLTTGIFQQLTDLPTLLTLGPELGLARTVGPAVGERAAGAVAGRLSPAATRFVGNVADRFTSGAIVGGLQNALAEAEKPGASPQSVGTALLVGAGLGGTVDVGVPAVASIGRSILDRAAELRPALARLGPGLSRFLTSESGELRLPGGEPAPPGEGAPATRQILGPRGEVLSTVPVPVPPEEPAGGFRRAPVTPVTDVPIPGEQVPALPKRPPPAGAQPIQTTPVEEVARLRLEDFPEDLRPTIQQAAERTGFAAQQRRGVIPDAVSEQMAQRYADDTTLSQLIRSSPAGTAFNEEQIRAVRNATEAQAAALNDAAAAIAGGDDSSAAVARFAIEAEKLDRLVQVAEGARAEAGRSMRAFRDAPQLQNLAPNEAVAQLSKMVGGDRQKLLDAIGEYHTLVQSGAGPVQMANFWAGVKNPPPGAGDWFKLIRYNSMLSGPRTFEVNATSNALELPWRFARDVAASTIRGRPGEVAVEANGAWAGLDQANRAFLDTLFQGITRDAAARGELPTSMANRVRNPVGRVVARGLEVPTRLLSAADEWAHAIAYNMSIGRLAAVQASEEGLRGQAWTDRVSHILSNKQTAPQLMQQAEGMANRMTFHGDMGNFGQGLQAFTQRTGILGNLIMPFLRTTYQITSRGIERSPLGLVGTGIDVARGAYGPRTRANLGEALAGRGQMPKGVTPLGERLGDNLIGSLIFVGLYSQAANGNISGAGPDEPGRRALLQSEGWQPYSVRIGDRWVSYANWGPAAIPFAMAAAAAETQRYAKPGAQPGELVLDGMRRTAQIAQEQTYLQAIGSAWKGITDPAAYGSQFVNDTVTSLLPFGSSINTLASAFDPNARRVDRFNALDAIQSRLPSGTPVIGGREDVPVAQDVLGRPSPNVTYGVGAINPLRVRQVTQDPVLDELDRMGVAPPGPPATISRQGVQLKLSPDEQRQVQAAAGELIAQRITDEMALPTYQQLDPKPKARVLQAIIDRARTQSENTWLSSLSAADYQQRKALSAERKELVPVGGR